MNKKVVTITSIIILIVIIPVLASVYYLTGEKNLAEVNAPDSSYKIFLKYKAPLLRGPFNVKIYYKDKNSIKKTLLEETMIFYDGSHLGNKNYDLKWEGNTATLTLKGDAEPYKIFLINIKDNPKIKSQY